MSLLPILFPATNLDTYHLAGICHVSISTLFSWLSYATALPCDTLPDQRLTHMDFHSSKCSSKCTWELSIDDIVPDSARVFVPMSLDLVVLENIKVYTCHKYCLVLNIASSEYIELFSDSSHSSQPSVFPIIKIFSLRLRRNYSMNLSLSGSERIARTIPEIHFLRFSSRSDFA